MALFTFLASVPVNGAQISLQFTRTTARNAWKPPPFKGGRSAVQPPAHSISSLLLQVRGGSDPYGYSYNDSEEDRKPKRSDYQEEKRVGDYYYGEQDETYYQEERRCQEVDEYNDRGRRPVSCQCVKISVNHALHVQVSELIFCSTCTILMFHG